MATKKRVLTKDEQVQLDKIALLKKQIGDKTPTPAQTQALKDARTALGSLTFVRVANKRIPKVLKSIAGIGALSGPAYVSTDQQCIAITQALHDAVERAVLKLQGKKESVSGFQLPTN
jgi:hypothetical protein